MTGALAESNRTSYPIRPALIRILQSVGVRWVLRPDVGDRLVAGSSSAASRQSATMTLVAPSKNVPAQWSGQRPLSSRPTASREEDYRSYFPIRGS
jgi:hypothetical protein